MKSIHYKSGYKHVLARDHHDHLGWSPGIPVWHRFFAINPDGTLLIHRGYAWNGASGPCPDTKGIMRASLKHDLAYQCFREGLLPSHFRKASDKQLKADYLADSRNPLKHLLAPVIYRAVRVGGKAATQTQTPIHTAP